MNKKLRCWVNQPSTLQPFHRFHGLIVWATPLGNGKFAVEIVSFLGEPTEMTSLALSPGWPRNGLVSVTDVQLFDRAREE